MSDLSLRLSVAEKRMQRERYVSRATALSPHAALRRRTECMQFAAPQLSRKIESEVLRERKDFAEMEAIRKEQDEERRQQAEYERSLMDERTAKILAERSRRAEAEEANRLADEAVWRANLQRRRKNEAAASRAPGRAALHEEEKRRLQPFIDMYKKQYDGKIENKALGNKVGDIGVNTTAYDADLGDPTRAADAPPHRVTLT